MATTERATFVIDADTGPIDDALKGLPRTAEDASKKMATSLDRNLKPALNDATKATGKLTDAGATFEKGAAKSASTLGKFSSALGLISPEAAKAAQGLQHVADGFEAASVGGGAALSILGPVAVAVGVLGAAYLVLQNDLENAEEALVTHIAAETED